MVGGEAVASIDATLARFSPLGLTLVSRRAWKLITVRGQGARSRPFLALCTGPGGADFCKSGLTEVQDLSLILPCPTASLQSHVSSPPHSVRGRRGKRGRAWVEELGLELET